MVTALSTLVAGMSVVSASAFTPDPKLKGFLDPNDPVAISFWIISIAMVAATVFFLMEALCVSTHWKTSMHVGALVTLVAAVHYFYMREFWVQIGSSPILYRYIDWTITVPLQMIEFYLILAAVDNSIGAAMFWRLMLGTVAMPASSMPGQDSPLAWLAGASSCTRSSLAKQVKLLDLATRSTSTCNNRSAPCDLLSLSAGPSTHWATSSDT